MSGVGGGGGGDLFRRSCFALFFVRECADIVARDPRLSPCGLPIKRSLFSSCVLRLMMKEIEKGYDVNAADYRCEGGQLYYLHV